MCFVIFAVIGALAVSLWLHGHLVYAALSGAISLLFLGFALRKIVKNAPCLFGKRKEC